MASDDAASGVRDAVADALSLYTSPGPDVAATLARRYAPDATFEDALVLVSGVPALRTQFASLATLFKSVHISAREPAATATPGGGSKIVVATVQTYGLPFHLPAVTIEADTALDLAAGGLIHKHVDTWRRVRVGGVSVPALSAPRLVRSLVGRASTAALRAAGIGGSSGGGVRVAVRRAVHPHTE